MVCKEGKSGGLLPTLDATLRQVPTYPLKYGSAAFDCTAQNMTRLSGSLAATNWMPLLHRLHTPARTAKRTFCMRRQCT